MISVIMLQMTKLLQASLFACQMPACRSELLLQPYMTLRAPRQNLVKMWRDKDQLLQPVPLCQSYSCIPGKCLETLSEQKRPEILRVDVIITGSHNQWPLHSCRLYPGMQSNSLAANPYTCAVHRWLTACFTSTGHHVKCLIYTYFIVLVYKI